MKNFLKQYCSLIYAHYSNSKYSNKNAFTSTKMGLTAIVFFHLVCISLISRSHFVFQFMEGNKFVVYLKLLAFVAIPVYIIIGLVLKEEDIAEIKLDAKQRKRMSYFFIIELLLVFAAVMFIDPNLYK